MKAWACLGALALLLPACSLAGDITPPPGPTAAVTAAAPAAVAATPAPASTVPAEQLGTLTGQVVNGTLNAAVPAGLVVTLHGFDAHSTAPELSVALTTTLQAGDGFRFENVPYSASQQFVVTALYAGATYATDVLAFAPEAPALETTLRIYETTTEPSGVRIARVHTFLEFASPQALTVGQLYVFSNLGDATYGGAEAPLHFSLPAGAADISVQGATEGDNLFLAGDGLDLAQAVMPGQRTAQVLLSFSLPYAGELDYEQRLVYPVERLNVLITDLAVALDDSALESLGIADAQGMQFQNFEQSSLPAGESLRFHLSGQPGPVPANGVAAPGAAATPAAAVTTRPWALVAGLGGLGLGLVGAGFWLYRRGSGPRAAPAPSREALLEALAELDERYAAHAVSEPDYQRQRATLKQRLVEQWQ